MKIINIKNVVSLGGDDCCKKSLPSWFVSSMNYPTYYLDDCLTKFDVRDNYIFCRKCGSRFLYYRMDMGFESGNLIKIPLSVSIPLEVLKKHGAPCFVIVHLFCCYGCLSSWVMNGTQSMIEVLGSEIDEEWLGDYLNQER